LQIDIAKLKGWGYLKPMQTNVGQLHWSSNGNPKGSISIQVNTFGEQPYIELDCKYKDEPRDYKVHLTSTPSNLNRGKVWHFICPHTKKRCRKLYLIGGYFLHREAFIGCMYETQTQSKKTRDLFKVLASYFESDRLYSELYKKNFKKTYAGKETKKCLRIIGVINTIKRSNQ
jgi:hypothetical protein